MDKLSLLKSRRMAENWLDESLQQALAAARDEEQRRLLKTLYARQKGALEYLSLVQLDMGQNKPVQHDAPELGKPLAILTHPVVEVVLAVALVSCVVLEQTFPAVALSVLTALMAFTRLTHPALRRKQRPVLPEVHEPFVEETDMQRFLRQQTDRIAADAASIAERQAVTLVRERQDVGEDAVELYCALVEASLDVPDPQLLAYPISMLKMALLERGLEPVAYAPETAALFDLMPADCPEGMRWPAIRNRETGEVLKRGLYLRPMEMPLPPM